MDTISNLSLSRLKKNVHIAFPADVYVAIADHAQKNGTSITQAVIEACKQLVGKGGNQ